MPGCDGHECAARLRARGVLCPIIGVTGNALEEDKKDFISAGASSVITKPVKTAELEASLDSVGLRLAQARRGSM
jgi:two-component system response regulator QseB